LGRNDNGSSDPDVAERGLILSSFNASPSDPYDSVLWAFDDTAGVEPNFAILGGAASAPYLFFRPYDWLGEGLNTNNDFLVYKVELERVQTPEPASLTLPAMGLVALGISRRRKS
jgi:hypothetical protein